MDTQGKYYDNACETVHCIMNINKFISFEKNESSDVVVLI